MMLTSEIITGLAEALCKAQAEFKNPPRSKTVTVTTKSGGKYTFAYAPYEVILDTVKDTLAKHGLSIVQVLNSNNGLWLTTRLMHSSGCWIDSVMPVAGGNGPQDLGSAITYARRYALTAILNLATEDDDDGNLAQGNHAEPVKGTVKPPATQKPAAARVRGVEDFSREIGAAATVAELNAIAKDIQRVLTAQTDRDAIRPVFQKRLDVLSKAGAR